jgi:hypothetical protein
MPCVPWKIGSLKSVVGKTIVAVGVVAAVLGTALPADAGRVQFRIDEPASDFLDWGATGRLVPGRGPTFSREEALRSLGEVMDIRCPCPYTIYLTLPPSGQERHYQGLDQRHRADGRGAR